MLSTKVSSKFFLHDPNAIAANRRTIKFLNEEEIKFFI
jgi:hypothetical protein